MSDHQSNRMDDEKWETPEAEAEAEAEEEALIESFKRRKKPPGMQNMEALPKMTPKYLKEVQTETTTCCNNATDTNMNNINDNDEKRNANDHK